MSRINIMRSDISELEKLKFLQKDFYDHLMTVSASWKRADWDNFYALYREKLVSLEAQTILARAEIEA